MLESCNLSNSYLHLLCLYICITPLNQFLPESFENFSCFANLSPAIAIASVSMLEPALICLSTPLNPIPLVSLMSIPVASSSRRIIMKCSINIYFNPSFSRPLPSAPPFCHCSQ
ncbi:Uncharacterized protein TCM_007895 [Theobroma cacao]|uniref:Uncharacterized protein n=1 Tax=Theobroma cacao TaxID=3641 RepID=A0A061E3T1_THECC|nr:Uncharacterized protein TCM_007895 [Theobroma cacao]